MPSVLCLGEILVDWVCTTAGAELDRAQMFTKAPGGAPANVAVGLARQGISTRFIGRVAADEFGKWLKDVLQAEGVDTSAAISDPNAQTRMAYVVTTMTGDRKLAEFTKIACADALTHPDDITNELFNDAAVLHFGSISLIASPAADATRKAVDLAKKHKLLVSYDPNVRLGLWPSAEACRSKILSTLSVADVVKINVDELEFLTGSRDLEAADALRREHDLALLIITLDYRGAYFVTAAGNKQVSGFQVQLVEATGAGDGFISGVISGLLPHLEKAADRRQALTSLTLDQLSHIIRRANAVGALTCTKAGAIPALPKSDEIDDFLEQLAAQASS